MADIIKQIVNNFEGSDSNDGLAIQMLDEVIIKGDETIMRFPSDIADSNRPVVHFECMPFESNEPIRSIYFPCPQGLAFSDAGEYTTFNLGMLGEFAKALGSNPGTPGKDGEGNAIPGKQGMTALQAANKVKDMAEAEFKAVGTIGASIIAARRLGADELATEIEFGQKTIMNPRTNTAFSGNSIRSFQFEFKMIGRSPAEVKTIDNIQKTFRKFVYAEKFNKTSSFMLSYPPQWIIRFVDSNQDELEYIPKIYTCYLTGVNTVINSSSNTFRRQDLSPYEIDISLQFQETKVLTRSEIVALEEKGDRSNILDSNFAQLLSDTKEKAGNIADRAQGELQKAVDKLAAEKAKLDAKKKDKN